MLSATEAARLIAARELSSEELVSRVPRARSRSGSPSCGRGPTSTPRRRWRRRATRDGEPARGPLHGIPVGVKDVIDTADMPTAYGSPIYAGHRPERDADCVAWLREAGAVVLGKTVTTEFATYEPPPTVNPHDPARTPGGSSSGSRRRGRRRHGAARVRDPDGGLGDPARLVLRHRRLQARARAGARPPGSSG